MIREKCGVAEGIVSEIKNVHTRHSQLSMVGASRERNAYMIYPPV